MKETINYQRIEKAMHYMVQHLNEQPKIEQIAAHIHLSKHHFQRMFKAWAGISPKKFLQYLTIQSLKKEIESTKNILELTENIGLSAPSRAYDLFVNFEAVTPGEYKQQGKGLTVFYGTHTSPFGDCFLAITQRGICALDFLDDDKTFRLAQLQQRFSAAKFQEAPQQIAPLITQIFSPQPQQSMPILLSGTPFQIKVWEALLKIPFGAVRSYQQIAHLIGNPKASRAVGSAIGQNHIGYLIPCHRVIRSVGAISAYKWNKTRKASILGWEKARSSATDDALT
ncbi:MULTISPECIES: methylated-DNA--[protein]-cysteine S-methyltransferase [unclassified Aureispira]|uniref:methylated-DNA--[protein]-cysteine S-methyltransferase n=1 Tax=unclassified Aureispira TaxID=2649989 RepID=UPI000696258C|nr:MULTISPECIES: methylated-DNA--[protein]-cysteine S-methyltransferase [unclassified Aureispira]WMX16938.1 methylated-DNA--[protein]-cysteine S-methyltransferase [Aureispira sp. CCB-E]